MKKSTKLLLLLLTVMLFVAVASIVSVHAETSGDWTYTVSGSLATITGYTGSETNLTIPTTIDGYSVSSIGEDAFENNTSLKSVTTNVNIGLGAFSGCRNIETVNIGSSVVSIGEDAFANCSGMKSVSISGNVNTIGNYAFFGCSALTDVYYSGTSTAWVNLVNYHTGSHNTQLTGAHIHVYPTLPADIEYTVSGTDLTITRYKGLDEYITLPNVISGYNVKAIGNGAFENCTVINLTIPEGVTSIGNNAFKNCTSLTSVIIPDSMISIGDGAFSGCNYLPNVNIPENVSYIGKGAFAGCIRLTSFSVSENNATFSSINSGIVDTTTHTLVVGFYYTTIPDDGSVTSIGDSAFMNCTYLTSIDIPYNITVIGASAFSGCTNLATVNYNGLLSQWNDITIGENNKVLSENLTYIVTLTATTDAGTITGIPAGVIHNGDSITLTVSDVANYYFVGWFIGDNRASGTLTYQFTINYDTVLVARYTAASNWEYTTSGSNATISRYKGPAGSIFVPEKIADYTVTAIGDYAFYYNSSRAVRVWMPDSITAIGNDAFLYCSNLIWVHLSSGLRTLGDYAFEQCTGLTEINLPDSLESIGCLAFAQTGIESLSIPRNVTSIDYGICRYCTSLAQIEVSGENTHYYSSGNCIIETSTGIVMAGCKNSVIPNDVSVTRIYKDAFEGQTGITSIIIPANITTIDNYAFNNCSSLNTVYYEGTAEEWAGISMGYSNNYLTSSARHYIVTLSAESTDGICNISYTPDDPIFESNTVTLTATAVDGWSFLGWYKGGEKVSNALVYEFVITGDTALLAKYVPTGSSYVTVNVVNGAEYTVGNSETVKTGGTETVATGSTITLTACSENKVLQWENESHKVLGRGGSLTLTVTGNMSVTLVYKSEGENQAYVQFVSDFGQVLLAGLYSSTDTITFPSYYPSKTGFTFDKWMIDGTDTEADEDSVKACFGEKIVTVKPVYNRMDGSYTVTVQYTGTDRADDSYADILIGTGYTVTAPDIDGKVFQMWKDASGTKILSYKPEYYLLVTSDVTLRAVYGDTAETAQPTITISAMRRSGDATTHKVAASVTRSIPDGYTLIEHGVLFAKNTGSLVLELDGVGVKKYVSDKTALNGVVTQNIKVSSDDLVVAMRGYMIVKDSFDVIHVIYTDIVTGSYTGLA